MSHKPRLSTLTVNAQAEATANLLAGGTCELMRGQPPNDPDTDVGDEFVLARGRFGVVPFGKAEGGRLTANKMERATAIQGGDPTWVRCRDASGRVVMDGNYGQKDANAVGNVSMVVAGQFVDFTGFVFQIAKRM